MQVLRAVRTPRESYRQAGDAGDAAGFAFLELERLLIDALRLSWRSPWLTVNPGGRDGETDEAEHERDEPERLEPGEVPEPIEHPSDVMGARECMTTDWVRGRRGGLTTVKSKRHKERTGIAHYGHRAGTPEATGIERLRPRENVQRLGRGEWGRIKSIYPRESPGSVTY